MSKRDYFITYCNKQDLCAIYRYAIWELSSEWEDKPVWERTEIFERWLNEPIDSKKWENAKSHSTLS